MAVVILRAKRIHTHPDPADGEVFWLEIIVKSDSFFTDHEERVRRVRWTYRQSPRDDGFTFVIRTGMRRVLSG